MAVLVTGGTGYIGSHMVVKLLSNDEDIIILDNLSNSCVAVLEKVEQITQDKKLDFYQGDILNKALLQKIFTVHQIDSVIHFAGLKAVGESIEKPLKYYEGAHSSGLISESPNDIPNNLMPYISQVAIGKREYLSIFGGDYPTHDGTGVRDYIHVVDLALGHIKALDKLRQSAGLVT